MTQPSNPDELDVVKAYRRQLRSVEETRRTSRAAPAAAGLGLIAAVAVAIVAIFASGGDATQALAISRQAEWIELRIADDSAGAEELTRELNEAGIRGRVTLVAVPPEYVGVWLLTSETAAPTKCIPKPGQPLERGKNNVGLHQIERVPDVKPKALRIPVARVRESTGTFLFVGGRPAEPGEQPIDAGSTEAEDRLLQSLAPAIGDRRSRKRPPSC